MFKGVRQLSSDILSQLLDFMRSVCFTDAGCKKKRDVRLPT